MKTIGLVFFTLVPIVANAANGCSAIDPTVAARLTDLMPVATVDAVIGCSGHEGENNVGVDGSMWKSKSYSDYQPNKPTYNLVIVTFRNGLLAGAVSTGGKIGDSGSTVVIKSSGYPPKYCTNAAGGASMCTP